MKILVFSPTSGWILNHIADRLVAARPDVFTLASPFAPNSGYHGFFYCDIQNLWHHGYNMTPALHIGLFTHLDKDDPASFRPHWKGLDGVVHMCQRYFDVFAQQGFYPPEKMRVMKFGDAAQQFPLKKVCIGVCQRGGFPGKGDGFLQEVLKVLPQEVADHLHIYIKGGGWDINSFRDCEVSVQVNGDERYETYLSFYDEIDYLLIPSLWEGGPMALLEALATGTPVIAPEVGWVSEFDIEHRYQTGNKNHLAAILTKLVMERHRRRRQVEGITYEQFADDLIQFYQELKQ